MGWFSGIGHAISDLVGSVDKTLTSGVSGEILDPLLKTTQNLTSDIFGKNSGATKLYDKITNHPAESAALAAATYFSGGLADSALGDTAFTSGVDAADTYAADAGASALSSAPADTGLGAFGAGVDAADAVDASAGSSFLPVTGTADATGTASLSSDLASQLGVSPGGVADTSLGAVDSSSAAYQAGDLVAQSLGDTTAMGDSAGTLGAVDSEAASQQLGLSASDVSGSSGGVWDTLKGYGSEAENWVSNNKLKTAMLALTAKNLLTGGQLSGSAKAAEAAAAAESKYAQGIIQSGGTSSPQWASEKASIDSTINANLKNAIEAAKQAAASSGMGGTNSSVVQAQIAKLTAQAQQQQQSEYASALSSIVSQAVSMLSGGNSTLTTIANMQMQADESAQKTAAETASLALGLTNLKSAGG